MLIFILFPDIKTKFILMNEQTIVNQEPTSDERLLGLLSHLSIFLGGIILPIIIWATQKDKSKFVKFHSLQSIFFHLAFGALIILFVIFILIILLISGLGTGVFSESHHGSTESMPVFMIVMMVILYGGIFLMLFGGLGYSIYLAVKTYSGNLIRIPVIGNIVYKKVYEQS